MTNAQRLDFNYEVWDECENIEIIHPSEPSPFCPLLKVKLQLKSCKKVRTLSFIAKLPRDHEFMAMDEKREEMFYKIFVPYIKPEYTVRCYSFNRLLDSEPEFQVLTNQPLILMDDLTENKYKQSEDKLDTHHLIKSVKKLAKFHADGYSLQTFYRSEYMYIKRKLNKLATIRNGKMNEPTDE